MKILKLQLKAYGPFTDRILDLSEGQHGLHIVYGPNEAGKSSSLRAITNLLFGMPSRTPDDFVHPYKKLRIGAELQHSDGSILEIVRKKSNKKSLLDANETHCLEDELVDRYLADVNRDLFRMMFGIDHQRLRQGGEEIVKGEGRIGELLFSAGAGITDLREAQKRLHEEIDKLLKSSGKSGTIIEDVRAYKETRQKMDQTLVTDETWKQHDQKLRAAQSQKDSLDEQIRNTQGKRNRLIRIRDATSAVGQWKKAKNDLADVASIPLLPEDFERQSNELLFALKASEQRFADAQKASDSLNEELLKLSIPEALLQEADATEAIRDRLGGYRKATADRPKLETKLEAAENEAKEILRELGRAPELSSIEELRLPNDKTIRIQNLGNQQEALVERVRLTRRDCEKTRVDITKTEDEIANFRNIPQVERLKHTLQTIQSGGDWEGQLKSLQNTIRELQENASIELEQLGLWSGTLQNLEKLAVPSLPTIERFADELNAKTAEIREARTRVADKLKEQTNLEQELATLELAQSVPTVEQLNQARALRDVGWQLIFDSWDKPLNSNAAADEFCQKFSTCNSLLEAYRRSVEDADQIADQLRQDADVVAKKASIQFQVEQNDRNIKTFGNDIETLENDLAAIEIRWHQTWTALSIKPLDPVAMRDWLHRQQQLAEMVGTLRGNRSDEQTLATEIKNMTSELFAALQEVDPQCAVQEDSLNELMRISTDTIEEIRTAQNRNDQLNATLDNQRANLVRIESDFAEAEQELAGWRSNWAVEMESLGLSDDALPSQANSVLTDIGRLFQKFRDADQIRIRLEGISRDAREFSSDVKALVGKTLPELEQQTPESAVSLLSNRLNEARLDQEKQDSLSLQIEEQKQNLIAATNASREATTALEEMCRSASCDSSDQLSDVAIKSRRRQVLENTVRGLEESISGQSGGMEFEAFLEEVDSEPLDIDSMQPKIDEFENHLSELNRERDSIIGKISEAKAELNKIDGGSNASELNLECESIAARLEENVQEIARLRLAAAVLHAAIEEYRGKNQGPILSRASEIFRRLTLEGFSGLQADFNDNGEPVLTGVRYSGGEKIGVEEMSDGTCDQLYLALRLASLENWLKRHEPVPFIVDDVLLNFDDDRAIACLEVLAELSKQTQVIFFTHHQHLSEIAKKALSPEDLFVKTLAPT